MTFECPVTKFQTNNIGSVHGGWLMTYVDIITTVGIFTYTKDNKATTSARYANLLYLIFDKYISSLLKLCGKFIDWRNVKLFL